MSALAPFALKGRCLGKTPAFLSPRKRYIYIYMYISPVYWQYVQVSSILLQTPLKWRSEPHVSKAKGGLHTQKQIDVCKNIYRRSLFVDKTQAFSVYLFFILFPLWIGKLRQEIRSRGRVALCVMRHIHAVNTGHLRIVNKKQESPPMQAGCISL